LGLRGTREDQSGINHTRKNLMIFNVRQMLLGETNQKMRWVGHEASMKEDKNIYRVWTQQRTFEFHKLL
jgi:hypothetical protein